MNTVVNTSTNFYHKLATSAIILAILIWILNKMSNIKIPQYLKSKSKRHLVYDYHFESGDLLCFYGGARLTRLFGESMCNHVALVYKCPDTHHPYVWEMKLPNISVASAFLFAGPHRGTRLTPLYRCIERSKDEIVTVRRLKNVDETKRIDNKSFTEFIKNKWNHAFALDFLARGSNRFFEILWHIPLKFISRHKSSSSSLTTTSSTNKNSNSSTSKCTTRYCAELVSETLQHLQVLNFLSAQNTVRCPHLMIPRDFSQISEHLPYTNGFYYGEEQVLQFKPNIFMPPLSPKKQSNHARSSRSISTKGKIKL